MPSRQLHAVARFARCRAAVVADDAAGEAHQDRRQSAQARTVRYFQLAEVAVSGNLLREILHLIDDLQPRLAPA